MSLRAKYKHRFGVGEQVRENHMARVVYSKDLDQEVAIRESQRLARTGKAAAFAIATDTRCNSALNKLSGTGGRLASRPLTLSF